MSRRIKGIRRSVGLLRQEKGGHKRDDKEHDGKICHNHEHLFPEEIRIKRIPIGIRFLHVSCKRSLLFVRDAEGRCGDADTLYQKYVHYHER